MSPISPTPSRLDVGVILPAAGKGERMGGEPKQFRPIAGVPLLLRALRPFAQHPAVRQIVVALPADVVMEPPEWLGSLAGERLRLVAGGATRAESVLCALEALDAECRVVLVHDAARPFVEPETIDAVIAAASDTGAIAAVPVSDTLKRADPTGCVAATVDRSRLWRAQTPQGFPREMLEAGYDRASAHDLATFTDEASLVEAAGFAVRLVADSARNIKITTTADLAIAECLARQ